MPVLVLVTRVSTYVSGLCLISRSKRQHPTQRTTPQTRVFTKLTQYIDCAVRFIARGPLTASSHEWRTTLLAWSSNPILRLLVILNINAPTTVTLLPPPRTIRTLLHSCWIPFSTMKNMENPQILLLLALTLCRSRRAIYTCLARLRLWLVHPRCLFRPPASHKAGPLIKTTLLLNHQSHLLANPRSLRVEDGGGHGRKSGS